MRKVFSILIAVGIIVCLMGVASCGDLDPAKAPFNAQIIILNPEVTWSQQCITDTEVCEAAGDYVVEFVEVLVVAGDSRTSGGSSPTVNQPLNNVEVSVVANGDLYLLEDDRSKMPPLAQPFYTETDERGRVELVWRYRLAYVCGDELSRDFNASVGTAVSKLKMNISCEASSSGDDDDDSSE